VRAHRAARPSAGDVQRIASHLEGVKPTLGKRVRCPNCDAVIAADDKRCLWCGRALSPGSTVPID
jgi:hypothetical protein